MDRAGFSPARSTNRLPTLSRVLPPGFVRVLDEQTLLLPERPGNRLADSLRNVLANPHVAMLFVIPGIGDTLRVNGRATIV